MSVLVRFAVFLFLVSVATLTATYLFMWTLYRITNAIGPFTYHIPLLITASCIMILVWVRIYASFFSRIIYYFVAIWWGLLVYFFFFSILYHAINFICKLPQTTALFIVLVPPIILFTYGFFNAYTLEIAKVDVVIPNLSCDFRIAHISDLHLGPIYGKSHVARIVAELKRLAPDFVAITGDLFDGSMEVGPEALEPFNELNAEVYFALGNHDNLLFGMDNVMKAIKGSKIILLQNEQAVYNGANIIGIDYSKKYGHLPNKLVMQSLQGDRLNILLYHVPELSVEKLEEFNVHLHLGGHTHGGQMFPLFSDKCSPFSYVRGLHKSTSGRSYVHISEGTGTSGPPLRMFSRSTITLLTVHS